MQEPIVPFEPIDTTTNSTVASVSISDTDNEEVTTTQTYQIRQPEEYKNEFFVNLRSSDIRKVRNLCENAKISKYPYHELLLGISTTFLGGLLGGLASNIELTSLLGIILYIVSPVISTSSFVAYLFVRKNSIKDINELVEDIEEYIPDPDKM